MNLQKFGVKLFFNINNSYNIKNFIPVFHSWIQDNLIAEHLLIDVADYSHMEDGPGVMLIAHEGNFSLDHENLQPGMLYMRKTIMPGSFSDRFYAVFLIAVNTAKLLLKNHNNLIFSTNSFRFITNDRLSAENTIENQKKYKNKIKKSLTKIFPNCKLEFDDISKHNERLAFTVKFYNEINILKVN